MAADGARAFARVPLLNSYAVTAALETMADTALVFLGQALAIAASAFAGAWFAFHFENRKVAREERSEHYAALRHAHLVLLNQHSLLLSLKADFPTREQQGAAWFTMRPIWSSFESPRLDIRSLVFTITEPHDPDLLNRLLITEQQFLTYIVVLEQRSKLHEKLQDRTALARDQLRLPAEATLEEIEPAVGQPLLSQLKSATALVLTMLGPILEGQEKRVAELSEFTKATFPEFAAPRHEIDPAYERK